MRALVTVVYEKPAGETHWGSPPEVKLIESPTEELFIQTFQLFLMECARKARIASHTVTLLPKKTAR